MARTRAATTAKPADHRESLFPRMARLATDWSGTTAAFILAAAAVLAWLATGPLFNYSPDWQLVINTGTTIVTFLMVFLIQRAQNKDSQAVHLKLNELVAAVEGASNRLINAESLTEDELRVLHEHYGRLVELAKSDVHLTDSHSVEEATERHEGKKKGRPAAKRK
jgi:low affinity Fe/Cu permease